MFDHREPYSDLLTSRNAQPNLWEPIVDVFEISSGSYHKQATGHGVDGCVAHGLVPLDKLIVSVTQEVHCVHSSRGEMTAATSKVQAREYYCVHQSNVMKGSASQDEK